MLLYLCGMNQIKYLIYSCLLIIALLTGYFFFSLIPSKRTTEKSKIDNILNDAVTAQPPSKGKELFQQNCQTCHGLDKKLSGPGLRGITKRGPWSDRKNLYKWVKNPAAFIPTTPYTKALQKDYGQIMPSFPQLTEKDVDEIIAYIEESRLAQSIAMH